MRKIKLILAFIIVVFLVITLNAGDEFPKLHGWRFRNTTYYTDSGGNTVLPWAIFARSFIGICPTKNVADVVCYLDLSFYEAYNAAFSTAEGNCYGMCLLANVVNKEEGHMGFCKPAYTYSGDSNGPASAKLCTVITVMQCHEWSHAGILWIVENFDGGHLKDPNYAYELIDYYLSMGDPPLLTIVKNADLEGHTLLPYRLEEEASGKRYIYVYDPNRWYPNDSSFYDDYENYVEIEPGGDWRYQFDVGETWSSPNGLIFATPSSLVKPASRNPLQLGGINDALNELFLAGGSIAQISDDEGHKFYKSSASSHNKVSDIEDNPSLRLKSVIRMPMSFARRRGKRRRKPPEIYFAKGSAGRNLNFEIASEGKKYEFKIAGKDNLIKLSSPGGASGRDNLKIRKLSTNIQELELSSKRGAAKFEVEMQRGVPDSDILRIFKVTNLTAPSSSPVKFMLTEGRDALLVKGEKGPVSCNLEISQIVGNKVTKMPSKPINVSGQEWQQVVPDNWNKLNSATIKVNKLGAQMPPDPLEKSKMPPDPLEKKK